MLESVALWRVQFQTQKPLVFLIFTHDKKNDLLVFPPPPPSFIQTGFVGEHVISKKTHVKVSTKYTDPVLVKNDSLAKNF